MSLRGLEWQVSEVTEEDLFAQLLKNRDIKCQTELTQSIFKLWPTQEEFPEIWQGVRLLYEYRHHPIAIVGDYDVDGTSATAIMTKYFSQIGIKFSYYIPNRFLDGYGLSMNIIDKIIPSRAKLVITLDNGSNSYKEIEKLSAHGIKSIVIDHHLIQERADATVLVNPVDLKEKPYNKICAAALTFIFLCEFNRFLVKQGFLKEKLNMSEYLDIVALATVCDVMPVTGINRYFISLGVEKLKKSPNKLFARLISLRRQVINNKNIGFNLGPYLNAAGRMEGGALAVEAMVNYSEEITSQIILLNARRKKVEKEVLEEALAFNSESNGICAVGEEWHEGVIGIVAGRLKEKFNKPTVVLTSNGEVYKGSLRAVKGFHCGNFIQNAKEAGLALGGGGHEMAGGISVSIENIGRFQEFFHKYCQESFTTQRHTLKIDCVLSLSAANENTLSILNKLQPFGSGNREPVFLFPNCTITNYFCTGDHCFFQVKQWKSKVSFKVFFISKSNFLPLRKVGQNLHIVASIVEGEEKIELELIDAEILN